MSSSFRSIAGNAIKLGSTMVLGMAFLVVATKVYAVLLGPSGVGLIGVGASLFSVLSMFAGYNAGTYLVRQARSFVPKEGLEAEHDPGELWSTTVAITVVAIVVTCALTLACGPLILKYVWVGAPSGSIPLLTLAIVVGVIAQLQVNLINAHHRVKDLSIFNIFSNAIGAVIGIFLAFFLREKSPPYIVLASLVSNLVSSQYLFVRMRRSLGEKLKGKPTKAEAIRIGRFAGPYTLSMLVGTGITMLMPAVVLVIANAHDAGMYKATNQIAIGYLGALTTVFMYDYLPRISAIQADSPDLRTTVNEHLTFMLYLITPLIVICNSTARGILVLGFSKEFLPAELLLQWMMAANVLRFAAWSLRYVVVSKLNSTTFLWTEAFNGFTLLGFSVLGMRMFGLAGLGYAFWAASLLHLVLLAWVLRAWTTVRLEPRNVQLLTLVTAICTLIPLGGTFGAPGPVKAGMIVASLLGSALCVRGLLGRAGVVRGAPAR